MDESNDVTRLIVLGLDREAAERGAVGRNHSRDLNGGPMDPLTQFGEVGALLTDVVSRIEPGDLNRPTPCQEFTVRGVLEHMIGGATAFAAAYRGVVPTQADTSDVLSSFGPAMNDLASAISAQGALARTIDAPFGEVDGETFARFVALDGLVHGWDLAQATGQTYEPSPDLVAAVDTFAHTALDPLRDGQTFKGAIDADSDAAPIERLAAYTGRRPL